MEHEPNHSIDTILAKLASLEQAHLDLGHEMFQAYGGAMYGMDFLAAAALNRSKAHIAGFVTLLGARNLVCAGALLRLQLDTAMRFYAAFLVEEPHQFALAVLEGAQIRDFKDRTGAKMTDALLSRKLGEEFEWVPRVYHKTSGYVHFSAVHMFSSLWPEAGANDEDRGISIKISAVDNQLPAAVYVEAAEAFCASTEILLRYVHGWIVTKSNPELVRGAHPDPPATA
jgi:hypothetical protein